MNETLTETAIETFWGYLYTQSWSSFVQEYPEHAKQMREAMNVALAIIAEHGECRSCAVKDPLGLAIEEEQGE